MGECGKDLVKHDLVRYKVQYSFKLHFAIIVELFDLKGKFNYSFSLEFLVEHTKFFSVLGTILRLPS